MEDLTPVVTRNDLGARRNVDEPGVPSSDEDRAVARTRSRHLMAESEALQAGAQAAVERARRLELEVGQLREGLAHRGRIEHVVGMLMLVLACDEKVAFEALTYVSSHTNRKVRDLAEIIAAQVAGGQGLPSDVADALTRVLGRPLPHF